MVSTQLPGIHNEDVLTSIFSFLPILDLARCAAVCKQWHEVVTGSTQIWKGKRYTSKRGQRISAEMRDVLFALPVLHKAEVQVGPHCYVNFSYPCLSLTVCGISDLRAVKDWQKVRCTYLSIHLKIAEFFCSSQSPIVFSALQKLNITKASELRTPIKPGSRAECAISCALRLCPNLRELSICVDSLSAHYLDALRGMSHLRTLKIRNSCLEKLVFLRHCSEVLEELELEGCFNVPSAAYLELQCLRNLRRLRLHRCRVEKGDLEDAVQGLRSLESVQLSMCISDVSFLRHCGQLREVSVAVENYRPRLTDTVTMGLRHLPASVCSLTLTHSAAIPDELSEGLPCLPSLEQLSLSCVNLDRLDFLCGCPQLRRLCLDYSRCHYESEFPNLRHLPRLETLDVPGHTKDLAFLSSVIPSLLQLDTLSVWYRHNVDYVGLLQDFPQLCSLSLFDEDGNLCDMSELDKFDDSIYRCKYVCKFVREVA